MRACTHPARRPRHRRDCPSTTGRGCTPHRDATPDSRRLPTRVDHPDAQGRHFIPRASPGNKPAPWRVWHGSGPLSGHVRHIVVEHLGGQPLTPDGIAKTLGVSRRTLTRRLTDEHTTFRSILDDVRRDFACALLQDRSLSIADVAYFLQYSEPTAFNRSFRRWTGRTPSEFRHAA